MGDSQPGAKTNLTKQHVFAKVLARSHRAAMLDTLNANSVPQMSFDNVSTKNPYSYSQIAFKIVLGFLIALNVVRILESLIKLVEGICSEIENHRKAKEEEKKINEELLGTNSQVSTPPISVGSSDTAEGNNSSAGE